MAACEAVARLSADPGPLRMVSAGGLGAQPGQSQIALVGGGRVVLTGTQVSFGYDPADARLAFERLRKELEQSGSSMRNVAFVHYYPLAQSIAAQIRTVRQDFFDAERPPAGSMVLFEGLTSMDAGFAVDVVAVK
jgi:enamine deaminase RidA (YjgF/YER057c/UK114 family)